jgi:serine/threonine-protein kinase RsbW
MLGVAEECVGQIELAVTEACTNVLRHVEGTKAEYEVSVTVNEKQCDIRLVDAAGEIFDHEAHGHKEANLDAESGRGIFLMRAMVDELSFVSEPENGSVVHLVKKLELTDDAILRKLVATP